MTKKHYLVRYTVTCETEVTAWDLDDALDTFYDTRLDYNDIANGDVTLTHIEEV